MDNSSLNSLIQDSRTAVNFIEDADAVELLKKLERFVADNNVQQTNPEVYRKLQDLMIKLKIVAFPNLPDEKSEEVLRNYYLESFDIEVPMDNRLTVKLFLVPYLMRDDLRKRLKKALLENNQKLGELTVGQWIKEFESAFDVHTRDDSAIVQFAMRNPSANKLSPIDKKKLKNILHTYDYLLVSTLPVTEPDLSKMLNSPMAKEAVVHSMSQSRPYVVPRDRRALTGSAAVQKAETRVKKPIIVKMNLNNALQKYPRIGEQPITSSPIKLKHFPAPARPSIKNWISDFHQKMGVEKHTMMERSKYLFNDENTKNLASTERQKLAYILKSLDEGMLLTIDAGNERIIFQKLELGIKNQESRNEIKNSELGIRKPAGENQKLENANGNLRKNLNSKFGIHNSNKISFSSPHKFLTEDKPLNRISPMGRLSGPEKKPNIQKKNPEAEGNTVDLRS